jgi:hypothetical protein
VLTVLVVMLAAAGTWAWARPVSRLSSTPTATLSARASSTPTATLRVDTRRPGNEFAPGAVGLSTEALELSRGYLNAGNYRLVRLMRLLGPSVLRIGGNSVDSSWWTSGGEPLPAWATSLITPSNLVVLHGLLAATGWKVLLGVDLGHFEPSRAADEARYASNVLGGSLLGVEIGNEPNKYRNQNTHLRPPTYTVSEYLSEVEAYRQALAAAAPSVAIYGPAQTVMPPWLTQMGVAARVFTELTQHYYPTSTCPRTSSAPVIPPPTVAGLLSPLVRQQEDEVLQMLALARGVTGRPTRIGETNGVACSSIPAVSRQFASALWSLDWSLRAASSGVQGLNFHGHFGVCGAHNQSPICAVGNEAARVEDVTVQPEYYGLLAARQLEGGRFVPTGLSATVPLPNLTTWATLAPGGTVRIAIDNLAATGPSQPIRIGVPGYSVSAVETLIGSSAEAGGGIVLGGAPVTDGGRWGPRSASASRGSRSLRILVRPASAVIVTLHRKRPGRH